MRIRLIGIVSLIAIFFCSCKNDIKNTGADILPSEDNIIVGVDTFSLSSVSTLAEPVYSSPDSFLIGECDSRWGTVHCDLLTGFACPEGFVFPETSELDSVCLFLYYNSWYGDGNSPLSLSVYEIDKQALQYTKGYPTDVPIEDFCSLSEETKLTDEAVMIVPAKVTDTIVSSTTNKATRYLQVRLKDEFAKKFFESNKSFTTQEDFEKHFRGLWITSEFGSASILHLAEVTMTLHYHFTYPLDGKDTTVNDIKPFYANAEVRQVNRILYPEREIEQILQEQNESNYVLGPANIYTEVDIPIGEMYESVHNVVGEKRPYVNRALMTMRVKNVYTGSSTQKDRDDWAQPASSMLLLSKDVLPTFFVDDKHLNDSLAIVSSLMSAVDSVGDTYYYYSYNLATILTKRLQGEPIQNDSTLSMVLVPVVSTASGSLQTVKPTQVLTATELQSAQSKENPMNLEVLFSGF